MNEFQMVAIAKYVAALQIKIECLEALGEELAETDHDEFARKMDENLNKFLHPAAGNVAEWLQILTADAEEKGQTAETLIQKRDQWLSLHGYEEWTPERFAQWLRKMMDGGDEPPPSTGPGIQSS